MNDVLARAEERVEARDKVTGAARYAADVRLPGMLEAAFLASPLPHARIVRIDTGEAAALPGVRAILTGADVAGKRLGRRLMDWPILADGRVRFVGDRVAIVAADTRAAAEEAVARIAVEYEELPAILDVDGALAEGAPVLHPDAASYVYLGGARPAVPHPNVQGRALHEHGDVAAGFARAAHVFEHEFTTARTHHAYLEPRAALVWWDGDVVHVVTTNKAPFALRTQLGTALGLPLERIVVDAGFIGGDFGGKGLSVDEFALVELARRAGAPVRLVLRYAEDMFATNTRHAARIRLRTGFDAAGRILAHDATVVMDGGAYAAGKPATHLQPGEISFTLAGYRVPAARVESRVVYTNQVPAGHMRAPGQPQDSFAAESHLDMAARAMRMDPLELRVVNALRPGDVDVHGDVCERTQVPRVLQRLGDRLAAAPAPEGAGRGIALGVRHVGRGKATIGVRVADDGTIDVLTALSEQGGGALTMLRRVVAAALGVPPERVRVLRGTTAERPEDPGVGGSRVTAVHGEAAREAAAALLEKAGGDAAKLAAGMEASATHEAKHRDANAYAYAADVRVDRETGAVTVLRILLVADVGTVINPTALRGQLTGGVVFGLGQALMEELHVEDGRVTNPSLGDYKIPSIADVPPIELDLLTDTGGPGPFGAKSVGELANPAVGPVVANAVFAASGARVTSLPVTAEKVLAALRR